MLRQRILIIVLAGLLPLWAWGINAQFSGEDEMPPQKTKPVKPVMPQKPIQLFLNPVMQQPLPDLNQGYLFNSERFLKTADGSDDFMDSNSETINMETLQYDGSVIVGETRKALVSFALGRPSPPAKNVKTRSAGREKSPGAKRSTKIITVGDMVAGYTVSRVEPLVLTFTRGGHEVKKELFGTEKERPQPPVVVKDKVVPSQGKTPQKIRPQRVPRRSAAQTARPQPPQDR